MYYGFPFAKTTQNLKRKVINSSSKQIMIEQQETGRNALKTKPNMQMRQRRTKQGYFTIKLSPQTKNQAPLPAVCDEPVQTKWKATSLHEQLQQQLHVSRCPEGPDIMSPPANYPHACPHLQWQHTGAVTLN